MCSTRTFALGGAQGLLVALALGGLAACGPGDAGAPAPRPDLVIVSWDTARADHVGPDATIAGLTPRWSRLASEGTRFSWARTPSPMTLPAHASLLTGRLPADHGARTNGLFTLPDPAATLAERLGAEGFRTGAFVSAAVLDAGYGLAQGFDVYDHDVQGGGERGFAERRADATVDAALGWIADVPDDQPIFLWVHLFDPHTPWAPPEAFVAEHPEHPYRGEIAYTDQQTGRLLDGLRDAGRLSRTLLVATADHGEGLGDHGERTHGYFLYDSTLRVPLLFWAGEHSGVDLEPGLRVDAPVLLCDVAATVLELLELPPLEGGGPSLLPLLRGDGAAQRELALESVDAYFVFGTAPAFGVVDEDGDVWIDLPRRERYDTAEDPRQQHDLYDASQKARADALFERHPRAWPPAAPDAARDAQREEQLAALGYLTGRAGAASAQAAGPRADPKDVLPVAALWMRQDQDVRPDLALAEADALAQRFGPLPALAFYRADRLDELARPEEATAVLREASAAHPEEARLREEIDARLERRATDQALARRIREVWQQQPDHPGAVHDLAVVLHRLGETGEAETLYRRWLATHPGDDTTRLDLHRLLGARGAFEEALLLLREVPPGPQRSASLDCAEGRLLAWWMDRPDEARPALGACREKGERLTPRELLLLEEAVR
jgi:arylsulfatase A-like enzyme/Flp pilus assembly protein TadD